MLANKVINNASLRVKLAFSLVRCQNLSLTLIFPAGNASSGTENLTETSTETTLMPEPTPTEQPAV